MCITVIAVGLHFMAGEEAWRIGPYRGGVNQYTQSEGIEARETDTRGRTNAHFGALRVMWSS
jgi:hypothetical protein